MNTPRDRRPEPVRAKRRRACRFIRAPPPTPTRVPGARRGYSTVWGGSGKTRETTLNQSRRRSFVSSPATTIDHSSGNVNPQTAETRSTGAAGGPRRRGTPARPVVQWTVWVRSHGVAVRSACGGPVRAWLTAGVATADPRDGVWWAWREGGDASPSAKGAEPAPASLRRSRLRAASRRRAGPGLHRGGAG
jgi:hypothetical protein